MKNTKAVLIIGGSGYVGTHLALRLKENFKVFATYHSMQGRSGMVPGVTYLPFNLENRNWIKRVVFSAQPDAIIYAAGSNDINYAEKNPRLTEMVHTSGAATIGNISDILQPKFIYLSNCYTFEGTKGNYHEGDTVLPNTILGKCKTGGENFVKGKSLNYVIIRSSPVYGRSNGLRLSFLDYLRMTLDRGQQVFLPVDLIHSFAPVEGLTEMVERVLESGIRNKILHYSGLTKVSYYEFGRTFAKRFGYDTNLVIPQARKKSKYISEEASIQDFSLNNSRTLELLKIKPLVLEEGFDLLDKKLIPHL